MIEATLSRGTAAGSMDGRFAFPKFQAADGMFTIAKALSSWR
jgi:mannose-1-phosphate guanylyltransferase/phosphomannomutase